MNILPALRHKFLDRWRTSLQIRVVGSIMLTSILVMLLLALVLVSFVTQSLITTKLDIANAEIDRARASVEQQIDATGSTSSVQSRLNSARAALLTRGTAAEDQAVYEPVVLINNPDGTTTSAPEGYRIPERLRSFVAQGQISYQHATIERENGQSYKALIIGTPTDTDIPNLQVYLVMSMESDDATLAMLRGLLSGAAIVLIVLLVGISWLLIQQVITPVRSASIIAGRFSEGHLRERMVVEGEDEMARLAQSFNSMAESLSKQITQLETYGDLQRQFTSDVSHELRTPLTTVRIAAEMLAAHHLDESDPEANTPDSRAAQLMLRELDKFESLLADLLEISRHDAGVAELADAPLDVRAPIQSAWQQVKMLAQELDVPVHFEVPDQPIMIQGEAPRVERILRNLFANAIDHSEGNPVEIRCAENDYAVAVTVTDHGVGLHPGQEELVFNRFWRADPSRKRHSGGTGLGLPIALEDALLHGGILDVAGTAGVGTMFRLVLPREPHAPIVEIPLALQAPDAAQQPAEAHAPGTPSVQSELPAPRRGLPSSESEAEVLDDEH